MFFVNLNLFWPVILIVSATNAKSTEYDAKYSTSHVQKSFYNMTNSDNHLFWFMQISDLHLSIFSDPIRIEQFKEFCQSTINAVKPRLVIASGDLTDGRTRDTLGTRQIKGEWIEYYSILNDSNITNKTLWMDIRGNHDAFNLINLNSPENYFVNYSIQGKNHSRSYLKQLHIEGNIYSFIALDACLDPGHHRPFHFIGHLDTNEIDLVQSLVNQVESSGSNYTIWFGHFPTSAILTKHKGGVRSLISQHKQTIAYLTGHFHTFGGFVPKMYTFHSEGFLELELGDWKEKRVFRLLAFDHGLLSFTDVHHNNWPIILVTNPKHALFVVPQKEDLNVIMQSSHIRILVFSLATIEWVRVQINKEDWLFCENTNGPLYVAKWTPDHYLHGLHTIHVNAKDVDGKEILLSQPFSLDGTRLKFAILTDFTLKWDFVKICRASFGLTFVISVLPLCILKFLHRLVQVGKLKKPRLQGCCKMGIRKLWVLTTVNKVFWPLLLYPIYLAIGPLFIGLLIEDHWGVCFTWGIFVNGAFLPGGITYVCSAIQILVFHIPLTIILANGIYRRFTNKETTGSSKCKTVLNHVGLQLPIAIILSFQLFGMCFCYFTFGLIAFIFGLIPTWSTVFAIVLWHKVLKLPETSTRQAAEFWSVKQINELEPMNSINADSTL